MNRHSCWIFFAAILLVSTLVSANRAEAVETIHESTLQSLAEEGDANAQWMMGQSFLNPGAPADDAAEAFRWFRRAADQGHPLAQRDLATLYELGRGVEKNLHEAFFWYSLASRQDSGRARLQREALTSSLSTDEQEAVLARVRTWRPTR